MGQDLAAAIRTLALNNWRVNMNAGEYLALIIYHATQRK